MPKCFGQLMSGNTEEGHNHLRMIVVLFNTEYINLDIFQNQECPACPSSGREIIFPRHFWCTFSGVVVCVEKKQKFEEIAKAEALSADTVHVEKKQITRCTLKKKLYIK